MRATVLHRVVITRGRERARGIGLKWLCRDDPLHLIKKLLKALFIDSKVGLRILDADELFNTTPLKLPYFPSEGNYSIERLSNFLKVTQQVRGPGRLRTQVS